VLRLHDTATGLTTDLVGRDPGRVGLYVCGSTVYGPPHIGHGRFSLVYDVLRRYLEFSGLSVDHVSNVTDIDDKIINRANEEARPWHEIAKQYEAEWWDAMDCLGCLRPTVVPHATEYIDEMVQLISDLVDLGKAYETSDGVYLAVADVEGYGLLAHQTLESLRSGARVGVNEEKRSPLDFALWKKAKPREPTWESPWGPGRPGWHTECVVMSLDCLGEGFDLHGGGQDLMFPHHENERAQAVAVGKQFSRHWMHNGMVISGGEKMSKSIGNVMMLDELLADTDPRAYRLLVLQAHYRAPIEVTRSTLTDAAAALGRLDALARRLEGATGVGEGIDGAVRTHFSERMDDDLDTPGATAVLFDALRQANSAFDAADGEVGARLARAVLECFAGVGLSAAAPDELPAAIAELGRLREEARAGRDFAAADRYRAEIDSEGYVVEDFPGGSRIHRKRSG
jgi:cysteinyl-tRNA synthetase